MKLSNADYSVWATMFFLSVLCFGIFTMVRTTAQANKNLEFYYLAGIITDSAPANFTCQLNLSNLENHTIQVYSLCYADPPELVGYCDFESSVANGTKINVEETVPCDLTINVSENPYEDGELYVNFYYVERTT